MNFYEAWILYDINNYLLDIIIQIIIKKQI